MIVSNSKNTNDNVIIVKSKLLKIICIILAVVLPVLAFLEIKKGDMVNFYVEIAFELPILVALILGLCNKYRASYSILIACAYSLLTVMSLIVKPTGPILFYRNVTYHLVALSLTILFMQQIKYILIYFFYMILVQVVFGVFFLIPAGFETSQVITLMVMAVVMYLLIGFFLIAQVKVNFYQAKQLDEDKKASEGQLEHISNIVKGASTNFDSISELSDRVDMIQSTIKEAVYEIAKINGNVSQIEFGSKSSMESIEKIGQSIDILNNQINELVQSHSETTNAAQEMVEQVSQVTDSAQAESGLLKDLEETSKEGNKKLAVLLENIKTVEERIQKINEMLVAIDGIATKTNLLAMNAAIEASHAGEAGKGFAVVASEIRKLADNSSKNSSEISALLVEVQESIGEVSEQSKQTRNAFNLIESKVQDSVVAIERINSFTNTLSTDGEQVLNAMTIVGDSSEEIRSSGQAVAEAQKSLERVEHRLMDSVKVLNTAIQEINTLNESVLMDLEEVMEVSQIGKEQAEELKKISSEKETDEIPTSSTIDEAEELEEPEELVETL